MSDKLTNAYALHAEIGNVENGIDFERASLKINVYAQHFFTVATWIIYLLFAASMYAAPLWVLQKFFGSNAGNYLAIVVIGVFLVVFPTALALGKHAGYKALSKRRIDTRLIGLIIGFFIASGIYLEITSATSQQQEKAHQAVENSNAGKSIMGTTITVGGNGEISRLIADAEYKLVSCQRKLTEGKTKDCKNSQAKVDSLKSQAAADREAATAANIAAIPLKQAALEKERESHALPIAKSMAELFGSTMATGAVIASLIASMIFEISHSLTIYNEWRLTDELAVLVGTLKNMKIAYFEQTGKQYDNTDFKESEVIDLMEMRESGNLTHFSEKLQDAIQDDTPPKKDFGFIPQSHPPKNVNQYQQEIVMPNTRYPTAADYAPVPRIDKSYNTVNRVTTQGNGVTTQGNGVTTRHTFTPITPQWDGTSGRCHWCNGVLTGRQRQFCCTTHKDNYWNWRRPTSISKRTDRII